MINKLLAVVDLYYNRSGDDLDKQSCISWLKSLRPQNHWRASKEQIEALENTFVALGGYDNNLRSLINDLRKLYYGR